LLVGIGQVEELVGMALQIHELSPHCQQYPSGLLLDQPLLDGVPRFNASSNSVALLFKSMA
jgi:hypothetical protein